MAVALTKWIERPVERGRSERSQARPGLSTKVCVTVPTSTRARSAMSERQRDAACIDLVPRGKNLHTRTSRIEIKFHLRAKRTRPMPRAASNARRARSFARRCPARRAPSSSPRATANATRRASISHWRGTRTRTGAIEISFRARVAPTSIVGATRRRVRPPRPGEVDAQRGEAHAHEDRRDRDQLPRTRSADEYRRRDATPCAPTSPRRRRRATRISAMETSGEHDRWECDAAQLDARARRHQRAPTLDAECIHAPMKNTRRRSTSTRAKRTRPARPAPSAIVRATVRNAMRAHVATSERRRDGVRVHLAPAKHTRPRGPALRRTARYGGEDALKRGAQRAPALAVAQRPAWAGAWATKRTGAGRSFGADPAHKRQLRRPCWPIRLASLR